MKEATGEVSMTVIVIVAVAVIGGILALMWGPITNTIQNAWNGAANATCPASQTWDSALGRCV